MEQDESESKGLPQTSDQDLITHLQEELKRVKAELAKYERILREMDLHPDNLDQEVKP